MNVEDCEATVVIRVKVVKHSHLQVKPVEPGVVEEPFQGGAPLYYIVTDRKCHRSPAFSPPP